MTTYSTGTISVGAGSTSVTGTGTSWTTSGVRAGDLLIAAGLIVPIASIGGNGALTLARSWPGGALSGANYDILLIDDAIRTLVAANSLMQMLAGGTLSSLAGLASAANKLAYFSGANIMALADLTSQARGLLGGTALSRSGTVYTLTGTLNGTAVMQSSHDTTAGRLAAVFVAGGIFGWGGTGSIPAVANIDDPLLPSGLHRVAPEPTTIGTRPTGFAASTTGALLVLSGSTSSGNQILVRNVGMTSMMWTRKWVANITSWTPWTLVYDQSTVVGTVSQSGGVPTGALIETGTNANGSYTRWADGTQICIRTDLSATTVNTALGSIFRSANVPWTFPANFASAPAVSGNVDDPDSWIAASGAPGVNSATLRALAGATKGSALNFRAIAVGRWF
ncbi:hypothetical protein [Gemmobacter sp.]|uniref:hypothetical protein n=1 Tax=Gemmobacter sp. TaxID=1898957 RepID=UPI002AFDE034|nr:hypothetical protein [Gemmobacter sp.]